MASNSQARGKGRDRQNYKHKKAAKVARDPPVAPATEGDLKAQTNSKEMVAAIVEWGADMVLWGQTVRDDIIRLEAAAGLPPGDPGDPPPPPWE